jgi:hypothetical protein
MVSPDGWALGADRIATDRRRHDNGLCIVDDKWLESAVRALNNSLLPFYQIEHVDAPTSVMGPPWG